MPRCEGQLPGKARAKARGFLALSGRGVPFLLFLNRIGYRGGLAGSGPGWLAGWLAGRLVGDRKASTSPLGWLAGCFSYPQRWAGLSLFH